MFWWLCLTSADAHSSSHELCESLLATRATSNCHIIRPTLISTSTASVSSAGAVAVPPLPPLRFLSSLARILTLEEDNSEEEYTAVTASRSATRGDHGVATAALIPLQTALDSTSAPSGASGVFVNSPSELWKVFHLSCPVLDSSPNSVSNIRSQR
jgi:hypothetical protein